MSQQPSTSSSGQEPQSPQPQADPFGPQLPEGHPRLPLPPMPGPAVTTVATDVTSAAESARHSSVTHSGLSLPPYLAMPDTGATRPRFLPPAAMPPARPGEQEIHVTPSLEMVCSEPGCGEVFTRKIHLIAHMSWHKGVEHVCDVSNCGIAFQSKSDLERHMLTHTGEKPFKCDICNKCFTRAANVKTHQKIHIREQKLKTRGTEKQGATDSGATDVPVAEEGGSTEDIRMKSVNESTRAVC